VIFYHLALVSDWEAALPEGEYRVSTLGKTVDEVGFMHGSFADQVLPVAEAFYAGVTGPLVLLEVDADRLAEPVRVEEAPGTGQEFPHIYGPLPVGAVVRVLPFERDPATGGFVLPPGVG
jgi:uncharacterized protein (DUF952 family)